MRFPRRLYLRLCRSRLFVSHSSLPRVSLSASIPSSIGSIVYDFFDFFHCARFALELNKVSSRSWFKLVFRSSFVHIEDDKWLKLNFDFGFLFVWH